MQFNLQLIQIGRQHTAIRVAMYNRLNFAHIFSFGKIFGAKAKLLIVMGGVGAGYVVVIHNHTTTFGRIAVKGVADNIGF